LQKSTGFVFKREDTKPHLQSLLRVILVAGLHEYKTMVSRDPFTASGLNTTFAWSTDLPFSEYVERTQQMIARARVDLTPETREKIIGANSPYQWPARSKNKPKKGILLVHGLYDSPFTLRDIGDHFAGQSPEEDVLVRSVLLPGHGTVPADLMDVAYTEWLKAVAYGVETLAQEVDQICIVGFSLGGLLALHTALSDRRITGLILIAPAFALQSQHLLYFYLRIEKWLHLIFPHPLWYKRRSFQRDYTKYESFAFNAGVQIYQLILHTRKLLQQHTLSIPFFIAMSAEDDVVRPSSVMDFFARFSHPESRLLWYARHPHLLQDKRIIVKSSQFPAQKICDFSHTCLPIAPENPHYGMQGDYQDFLAYPDNQSPLDRAIFLGSASKKNMRAHNAMQRVSYNPDFAEMVREMGAYLERVG
jgi:esterase/lipase